MKLKRSLFFLLVLSPGIAWSEVHGFDAVQGTVDEKSQIEITNVPPLMSQDTVGECFAVVASTILTAENCRELKENCPSVPATSVFSSMGLAPLGRLRDDQKSQSKKGSKAKKNSADDGFFGGNMPNTLLGLTQGVGSAPSEDCLSLDKILSKIGGASEATQLQMDIWKKLQGLYNDSKKIKADCPSCKNDFYTTAKDEIEKNFDVNLSNEAMLKAFAETSFNAFFDRLFSKKECQKMDGRVFFEPIDKVEVEFYPKGNKKGTFAESMKIIKKSLDGGHLLGFSNLCLDKKPSAAKCQDAHAVVIAGYRKVCNSSGACKDSLKVINSWGSTWQKENNEGWIDAQTVLDRTFYKEATLTWFQEKK